MFYVRARSHYKKPRFPELNSEALGKTVATSRTEIPNWFHVGVIAPPGDDPPGFEAQVRPRSGLALNNGLTVLNSPGTIDSDYRGEVKIILANLGDEPMNILRGTRIAQMVFCPVETIKWRHVTELEGTDRGAGGFGSTGTN